MNYEILQDEIVTRLQPFTTADIAVERLPEVNSEKTNVLPTKARFTVIYAGSEYDGTMSTSQVSQNEKVFIQILVESTFLYGPRGVYNLVSVLKKALTDFRPQGITKMQVSKHHMIGQPDGERKNNMWQYQVIFQGNSFHVEEYDQGEDLSVLLKKITYKDGEETVIVPNPENPEII